MKKVAIIGCAKSKEHAPFDDEAFEIWGLNMLYTGIPEPKNLNRWFEIHSRERVDSFKSVQLPSGDTITHVQGLNQLPCPIYMQRHHEDIPNSVAFPIELFREVFGDYFTCTASYMIAMAIYEGYEEIHIYGVDMAADTEYASQRPSCEYFIGIAEGKGIKVVIPLDSDLLKTLYLYGFEDEKSSAFQAKMKSRLEVLKGFQNEAIRKRDLEQKLVDQYLGAITDCEHVLRIWSSV